MALKKICSEHFGKRQSKRLGDAGEIKEHQQDILGFRGEGCNISLPIGVIPVKMQPPTVGSKQSATAETLPNSWCLVGSDGPTFRGLWTLVSLSRSQGKARPCICGFLDFVLL